MAEGKQVQDLGTHCSFGQCGRLDFLPIKCDLCSLPFCREHSSYSGHQCANFVEKVVSPDEDKAPKAPLNPYKCSFENCTNREMLEVVCEFCRLNFCMKHRLQCDHKCAKKLEEDRMKEEALANRRVAPKEFKFEMKQNVSDKNAALAAKVLLMKLKQSAQGPPGLTDDLKYFCYVEYLNEVIDTKAPNVGVTKKPFFFSTKWPVGRCIEFVLDKLGASKSSSTKLRLFVEEDVYIDSSKLLGDFIKESSLPQGVTLGLKPA